MALHAVIYDWNTERCGLLRKWWTEDQLSGLKIALRLPRDRGERLSRSAVLSKVRRMGLVGKGRASHGGGWHYIDGNNRLLPSRSRASS